MNSRFSYTLLGLFVILLGGMLIAGVLWLGSGGLIRPQYDRYLVYTQESVTGLSVDSRVTYKGVNVGQVAGIELFRSRPDVVRLLLEVREGTPVTQDTVAQLQMQGLTGLSFIDLSGGSADSAPLEPAPGEPYPVIPSEPSFYGRLDKVLTALVNRVSETAQKLDRLFSEKNRQRMERILAHLETISGEVAGRSGQLGTVVDDFSVTMQNVREASGDVPALIGQLRQSAEAVERTAREIERAGKAGGELFEDVETSALPTTRATLEALRAAAGNLRRMSEQLQRDPSVLIYGSPPPRPGPGE